MDDPKKKILDLIEKGRYRASGHFLKRARERSGTIADALRALRSGALQIDRCEGENYCYLGLNHRDERIYVVVKYDPDSNEEVVIHSLFPENRK